MITMICPGCNNKFDTNNKYRKFCSKSCYTEFKRSGGKEPKCHGYLGNLTISEWNEALKHFNNSCAYCGKEKSEDVKLQQEHFIPIALDGKLNTDNTIPACSKCNASKHSRDPLNWYKQQPFFSKDRLKKILEYLEYI